jgi:hypothetical protein
MYPYSNPYGRSRREPDFASTFMADRYRYAPTRGQSSATQPRASQSNRSNNSPATRTPGTTTVIRPGEPHHYGTRIDRQARANLINPLCRCRNPDGHRDAWAFDGDEPYTIDNRGVPISWKQAANRVLDQYPGKIFVSWDEVHEAYRPFVHPRVYRQMMAHYNNLRMSIAMGHELIISPHQETLQFYGGDGHARNAVTEDGLRTMVQRPGRAGRS